MAEVSIGSLMVAIQCVKREVDRLRDLAQSETITDAGELEELAFTYEQHLQELADAYRQELVHASNYPSYEELLQDAD